MQSISESSAPTFVDLFAGCGGLSLGFQRAGLRPLFAVERSDMAAATYSANFHPELGGTFAVPSTDASLLRKAMEQGVIVGDILEVVDLLNQSPFKLPKPVDVVVGGPPCQGFSMAGRRKADDPRNLLPFAFF